MRCAACNVMLDPARIAACEGRCVCGATLDLPGAPPPRSAPSSVPARAPVVELQNVGAELTCPRCDELLSFAFQGSHDVQECRRCLGAFVEARALDTFVEEARTSHSSDVGVERQSAPSAAVPIEKYARCPSCREYMQRTMFGRRSGVVVDVCRAHGTWFDAGELAKVLAFEADGGAARVERQEREEEERRKKDPMIARELARAQAVLLEEQVREARAVGRWAGGLEGRDGFLDILGRSR